MNNDEVLARLEDIAEQAEHITSVVQSTTFKEFVEDVVAVQPLSAFLK